MSEHRSFWTAVGITMLTVGLTGFISLEIAGLFAPAGKHVTWYDPLSLLCILLFLLGSISLVLVLVDLQRLKAIKLRLSSVAATGQGLFHDLRIIADDDDRVPDLRSKAILWIAETGLWLNEFLPEFEGHFANVSGLLNREQLQATTDRNVVLVSLETHLERIGEITLKI